jgi:amino acid transporter
LSTDSTTTTGSLGGEGNAQEDASLYTRRATGLVRQVSPRSALVFNLAAAPAPFILAVAIFFTFGVAPGGNIYIALTAGYLFGAAIAVMVAILTTALPRSGGDYILVSRMIHPMVGLMSSFCETGGVLLSIAWIAVMMAILAIGPSLTVLGLISRSQGLVNAGAAVATEKGWIVAVGIVVVLLCGVAIAAGWKWTLRVQNTAMGLAYFGLLVTLVVLVFTSRAGFISHFNLFANPQTHQNNSYAYMISQAVKNGIQVHPKLSLTATWPSIGAVMGVSMYYWFSTNIAGEVRQARTRSTIVTMLGAVLINLVLLLGFTALFFHVFGSEFFRGINGLSGTSAYPFATSPSFVFLTSIAGHSTLLAGVLGVTFILSIVALLLVDIVQPIRAIFAYAFDGVMPLGISRVSPRSRIPVVALAITISISCALTVWAAYSTTFFGFYVKAVLLSIIPITLMSISAIVLPYRRPELWQASVMTRRFLGVPVVSLFGVVGVALTVLQLYLFLHYRVLGLPSPLAGILVIAYAVVAAAVVYIVAAILRARQGISLTKAASQIPGE